MLLFWLDTSIFIDQVDLKSLSEKNIKKKNAKVKKKKDIQIKQTKKEKEREREKKKEEGKKTMGFWRLFFDVTCFCLECIVYKSPKNRRIWNKQTTVPLVYTVTRYSRPIARHVSSNVSSSSSFSNFILYCSHHHHHRWRHLVYGPSARLNDDLLQLYFISFILRKNDTHTKISLCAKIHQFIMYIYIDKWWK